MMTVVEKAREIPLAAGLLQFVIGILLLRFRHIVVHIQVQFKKRFPLYWDFGHEGDEGYILWGVTIVSTLFLLWGGWVIAVHLLK